MKIALLGYGRMGQTIEKIAVSRGHMVPQKIDKNQKYTLDGIDVAIDFSIPTAAVENITQCLRANVPIICGTTGWLKDYKAMVDLCKKEKGAFLYASNFSVGVNIFFELNKQLAQMMQHVEGYTVSIDETHHIHKLDAPSGTAITLAEGIIENRNDTGWILDKKEADKVSIYSFRESEIPGTHSITYKSGEDQLFIEHKAYSRQGFALGAVLAAEFLIGKNGVFGMKDVLGL